MSIYSVTETEKLINHLIDNYGYELIQLDEGGCGLGDLVLIAPDEKHYNFIIKEVFLNEWSSGQTIRRAAKISKELQKRIEAATA